MAIENQGNQMPGADRDDEGTYVETYPNEDFLDVLTDSPKGTQEIADAVGCNYQTAYKRLNQLADEDKAETRKIGNSRLWTQAEE